MTISRLLLLPVIALGLVAAGCGGSGAPKVPADAVAVVGDSVVAKATLDSLLSRAKISYKQNSQPFPKAGTAEYKSLQQQALAFLVKRAETDQEAVALGVKVTPKQIQTRVDEIKKQYYKNDQATYLKEIKAQGFTDATLREELRASLVSEGVFNKVTKDVKVSDAEVRKNYDQNKATYTKPKSRDVRHILVKEKALATQIRNELVGGADFAALATKHSTDPGSKDLGGKYTVAEGQTVAPFEKAAFSLKTDEISQPVKTEFGYHIIQPTGDLKPATVTPFAEVKTTISAQLLEGKKTEAMTAWDEEIKAKWEKQVGYAQGFAPPAVATTPTTTANES
jgi:foldase protein PrsA